MTAKSKTIVLGIGLLIILVGIRIGYVNYSAPPIVSKEHYQIGEWVELDGAFLSRKGENTQGYSLRVIRADRISYNDYIELYGIDKTKGNNELYVKSVIAVELEVKNTGNKEGGVFVFECKLVPARKNEYFIRDAELWCESEPRMEGNLSLRLVEDTKYTTVIPYKRNEIDEENLTQYKNEIKDTSFELVVSNAPVKKVIDIEIEE